jgi:HAD superfamily hydrolase (TIGR01509 family)
MKFSGFVFDFDGLMLDTEIPRFTAWQEAFEKLGFSLTYRDWWKTIGTGPSAYDPSMHLFELTNGSVDITALRETAVTRADELLESAELLPGVKVFIESAARRNLPMAVASSSDHDWVFGHLENFSLLQYFQTILTAQDVQNVKPDPELYLLAVKKLALSADSVLAFEDSPNGIKAAKLAGLRCVAVPNRITREMDLSLADLVIDSFNEIHPEDSFPFDQP